MRWRRSEKRPKWSRPLKRSRKKEDELFRFENLRLIEEEHSYKHRNYKTFKGNRLKEPAPLVDVFREKDKIIIVAELKGFKKENIRVQAEKQRLTLTAKAQERKYYKSLDLPEAVIPDETDITYKNGVLEIRLKKALEAESVKKVAG